MTVSDGAKNNPCPYLTFNSIRGEQGFEKVSTQMLRVLDMRPTTVNYEAQAMNEFRQNPQKYPLLNMLQQ